MVAGEAFRRLERGSKSYVEYVKVVGFGNGR